jgi:hypothetical protein
MTSSSAFEASHQHNCQFYRLAALTLGSCGSCGFSSRTLSYVFLAVSSYTDSRMLSVLHTKSALMAIER